MDIQAFMAAFPESKYHEKEPLKYYAYTKVGGPADLVVFPQDAAELQQMVEKAQALQLPYTVLGNSSNVIVRDGGLKGIVFMLTDMNTIQVGEDHQLIADAGARIIDVSQKAKEESWTGLEFACGIPGSVGGAAYMNAGAYGGEISEVFKSVLVITAEGQFETIPADEMNFSYRHSVLQENGVIAVSVTFQLAEGDLDAISERMADLTHRRESKQPLELPSCGSVFKRPAGHYTGQLIQSAKLQGYTVGGAQVSKKHAGFIVNIDHASAQDYLDVIHHVQEVVYEQHGVHLETEVRIIGREKIDE
ncbi:MAG: UDP-N-acetylmuramate dehydrogenase [Aerococcus sp.]|nr:UDP-N-acetylmuramate dehydrogenase [Aerococcus sp.]